VLNRQAGHPVLSCGEVTAHRDRPSLATQGGTGPCFRPERTRSRQPFGRKMDQSPQRSVNGCLMRGRARWILVSSGHFARACLRIETCPRSRQMAGRERLVGRELEILAVLQLIDRKDVRETLRPLARAAGTRNAFTPAVGNRAAS